MGKIIAQHHGGNHCSTSWGKSLLNIMGEIITVLGNHKGLPPGKTHEKVLIVS
jgi:hypothetical protein